MTLDGYVQWSHDIVKSFNKIKELDFLKNIKKKYKDIPEENLYAILANQVIISRMEGNLNYREDYDECEHCGRKDDVPVYHVIEDEKYKEYEKFRTETIEKNKKIINEYGYSVDWIDGTIEPENMIGKIIKFR